MILTNNAGGSQGAGHAESLNDKDEQKSSEAEHTEGECGDCWDESGGLYAMQRQCNCLFVVSLNISSMRAPATLIKVMVRARVKLDTSR